MRKVGDIIGKPVQSPDGKKVGKVADLVLDDHATQVLALVVKDGKTPQVVLFKSVQSFGQDAVMVPGPEAIQPGTQDPTVAAALQTKSKLKGKPIMTAGGTTIGAVSDLLFDDSSGSIQEYEIAKPKVGDSKEPMVLPPSPEATVSPKTIMVPEDLKDQLKPEAQVAPPEPPLLLEKAKQAVSSAKEKVGEMAEEKKVEALIGKPASKTVLDPKDAIILNSGETITHAAVEKARQAGAIDQLLAAG